MGKKNRGVRANWDEEMLAEALDLIKKGKSQRYVEQKCGIPRRTIRNHIKTQSSVRKLGRRTILSKEEETDLENKIIRLADKGFPLTPKSLRRSVFRYVEQKGIRHCFNRETQLAGREWFRVFLKNHPKISKRRSQIMNPARAQKLNRHIVDDHFKKLGELLESTGLKNKASKIYNMDEKGCRLTLHHQQSVLAAKGAKRVHLVAQEHAENATIVACANALGQAIPPVILFKGKRMKPTFSDGLPTGSKVMMSPKGSMTIEIFNKWLDHFIEYMSPPPVILVFDGAKCHLDITIAEKAEEHGIHLYCLPSNTTHELQPMDKAVFRAYEAYWDDELMKYWDKHPTRDLNKERFSEVFLPTWEKTMTIANITSGFRATGICPYDKDILPFEAFAPSLPTERPPPNEAEDLVATETESEYDSDDLMTLSALKQKLKKQSENSFSEVLPSPDLVKKRSVSKRKAINYKAVEVKRAIFSSEEASICSPVIPKTATSKTDSKSKPSEADSMPKPSGSKSTPTTESWECVICFTEYVADMRKCVECQYWVHEECAGLTADDTEDFLCPECMP